jgi:hypothetical protein
MNTDIEGDDSTEQKVISLAEQNVAGGRFVRGFMVSILEERFKVERKDEVIAREILPSFFNITIVQKCDPKC